MIDSKSAIRKVRTMELEEAGNSSDQPPLLGELVVLPTIVENTGLWCEAGLESERLAVPMQVNISFRTEKRTGDLFGYSEITHKSNLEVLAA